MLQKFLMSQEQSSSLFLELYKRVGMSEKRYKKCVNYLVEANEVVGYKIFVTIKEINDLWMKYEEISSMKLLRLSRILISVLEARAF
ncbi:hypothetical protein ACS0TY_014090 [Phlomoides rotata]